MIGRVAGVTITPATLTYGEHPSQSADLYLPASGVGPYPVVVLIHGGFWRTPFDRKLMVPLAENLVGRGYAVLNIDYRRVGEVGGGWTGTFDDVVGALELLNDENEDLPDGQLDLERVAAVGHSAGGHLALWLASEYAIAAVVSQAGVSNLHTASRDKLGLGSEDEGIGTTTVPAAVQLLGGTADVVPDRFSFASPASRLPLEAPVLLVHGGQDDRVPASHSREFTEAAQEAGDDVTLAVFEGAGHFELIDPAHESWAATVAFLDEHLKD